MTLKYEDITGKIIGAAYEVHNVLGYGFLEKVYQRALQVELIKCGLQAELEFPIRVWYKGAVVGDYVADIFVERKVIVELKVARAYRTGDEAQILNELKASGVEVGLLINFGQLRAEAHRFVFSDLSGFHPGVHPWPKIKRVCLTMTLRIYASPIHHAGGRPAPYSMRPRVCSSVILGNQRWP